MADPRICADLFVAHAAFVARFLARLGVAPDDIDDVLQEVFLVVAHRGFDPDRGIQPTTYLGSIAVRAASTHRRRRERNAARAAAPHELGNVPSRENGPVRAVELGERLHRLQDAINRLDDDVRGVFVLFELEGESCEAIAAAFEIPVGTVYSRLYRARRVVRSALKNEEAASAPPARMRKVLT